MSRSLSSVDFDLLRRIDWSDVHLHCSVHVVLLVFNSSSWYGVLCYAIRILACGKEWLVSLVQCAGATFRRPW
jgi:hypothetical protein